MTKATILLAEDDEIMRVTLTDFLAKNGWSVDEVSDGREAREKLRQNCYQLVVSDIRMPGGGGFDLLDEIRLKKIPPPIIFMTAYGSDSEKILCMQKGAAAYLLKPFEMDELLYQVRKLLSPHLAP
ncbi:MAG: response regulator [Desulfobulbaceae bacterium]|nr:response regulator [Desulfobulbaceae bacterium]